MTTANIYFKTTLNTKVSLTPDKMNKNIEKILLDELKKDLEGRCSKDGYIKKGSIEIVNRTLPRIDPGHFNGELIYNIEYSASVCNPTEKQILQCNVVSINKIGVLCILGDSENQPLKILLPRHTHLDSDEFKNIEVDNKLKVEVVGCRFELNESFISVVGKLIEVK